MTKERPILFSGPMVRAILDGRKTMTRRCVKNPDWLGCLSGDCPHQLQNECDASLAAECPYGTVGTRLWARETFAYRADGSNANVAYAADGRWGSWSDYGILYPHGWIAGVSDITNRGMWVGRTYFGKWRPSIHMPRWASRITLEITGVRVERLQDITEDDAVSEGFVDMPSVLSAEGRPDYQFRMTWDTLNEKRGFPWASNPWVWVVYFRDISQQVQDALLL